MTSTSSENGSSPIKTGLFVIAGSAALIISLALLVHYAVSAYGDRSIKGDPSMSDEAVAGRLKPVGELAIVDPNAPKASKTGEEVYAAVCSTCHAAGVLNAPKFGDKAAWTARIAAGYESLVANAVKGIRGMPARGGNPDLTDVEVARAVAHMTNAAGANFKAPDASTTAPAATSAPITATAVPATAPAPVVAAAPTAAAPTTAQVDPGKGKSVYETTCSVCHGAGVAGAPKFADKAAWGARIAQGLATLHEHAVKGFQGKAGVMPPKGGNAALVDADVIAAVDYMVSQAK
jgi:cytochrome c5